MHVHHVPKIIEREEENCYLLINRKNGHKLVLNESSFYVWTLCDNTHMNDIIKKVVDEFDMDEKEAEEKIHALIDVLSQKGFIEKED
jgi:predicted deacetylase